MATPFLGELKVIAWNYAPNGWAFCDGQLLPVATNAALYSLLGNYYGGTPELTFALPDLRGRAMAHLGPGEVFGSSGGATAHTLTVEELPPHSHELKVGVTLARKSSPAGATLAATSGLEVYAPSPDSTLASDVVSESVGGGVEHDNVSPYLALNVIIALTGILPAQS